MPPETPLKPVIPRVEVSMPPPSKPLIPPETPLKPVMPLIPPEKPSDTKPPSGVKPPETKPPETPYPVAVAGADSPATKQVRRRWCERVRHHRLLGSAPTRLGCRRGSDLVQLPSCPRAHRVCGRNPLPPWALRC